MEKMICDDCNKEIDMSEGYFIIRKTYTERDFGLPLSSNIADLCCQKCLIEFAKSKRCEDKKRE